jgi:uncharacterized membrane protein YhfC
MDASIRLLNGALMIVLPLALATVLARRLGAPWPLFGVGAITFIGSQVVHLPLLQGLTRLFRATGSPVSVEHTLLFNAIVLGLAAGLCEEGARWLGYRFLVPNARRWRDALMLGAGHGGAEAIALGTLVVVTGLRTLTMATVPHGEPSLLGALERVFALCSHLAMSVLVLQAFLRRTWLWLAAAIVWHALLDGSTVYFGPKLSRAALEGVIGLFALVSVGIVFALRPSSERASSS